jgi:hypothetical protein
MVSHDPERGIVFMSCRAVCVVGVFFGVDVLITVGGTKEREDCEGIEYVTKKSE